MIKCIPSLPFRSFGRDIVGDKSENRWIMKWRNCGESYMKYESADEARILDVNLSYVVERRGVTMIRVLNGRDRGDDNNDEMD